MTRKLQVAVASVLVAVAVAAPAAANSGRRADFDLRFTTQAPDAPTGLAFHILYKDERDPNGKPQPIRRLVVAAPEGTRFDGSAVPRCSASDDDLRMHGRAACPAASEVGRGVLTVATGFGPPVDPVTTEATLYNGGDQVIEVVSDPSSGAPLGSDRLHFDGSQLVANPPAIPGGPPDGQGSVRLVDEHIDPHRGFVVTPPSCSGTWAAHGTFGFADGAFETVGSTLPCAASPASKARSRSLRVRVRPRRVRVGRVTRVRVVVGSAERACRAGAIVRVGRRRYVSDARGRVTAVLRSTRTAVHRVRAAKPGCGTAVARLRAVR